MNGESWTESRLLDMLQNTYKEEDGHCVLSHVRSDTGTDRGIRTADALKFGLWKSRGLDLTGYEVKISRTDWLKELDNPAKADEIAAKCHFWFIVAPVGVVPLEELPTGWGLMEPARTRLKIIRKAVQNVTPDPMGVGFVAAIMRQFMRQKSKSTEVEKARNDGYRRGREDGHGDALSHGNRALELEMRDLKKYREAFTAFQESTGIQVWDPSQLKDIAEAVKWVNDKGKRFFSRLDRTVERLKESVVDAEEAQAAMKGLK